MKIISLIASATEIICALGLEGSLVGRSHECDYPLSILTLPRCTETKFRTEGTSLEIDARIKDIVRNGLSVYKIFEDQLYKLRPDLIVTQIQCEVCAVSENDVRNALCSFLDYRPKIVSLNPGGLEDIWNDIHSVAEAAGVLKNGAELISRLKDRINSIFVRTQSLDLRPTVACIEWIDPLMVAGNWMPELVQIAGGTSLFGIPGKHSPYLDWANLVYKDPDIIVILPCGWDIGRSRSEMKTLVEKPEWPLLNAVKNRKIFLADGNQYFNRPGPRVVESLEILAEIIHPELFHFGHQMEAWEQV